MEDSATRGICLTSDSTKQPIVIDTEEKTVVYPSAKCGGGEKGEQFVGKKLAVICTGRSNRLLDAQSNAVSVGNVPYDDLKTGVNELQCERVNEAITIRDKENDDPIRNCTAFRSGFELPRGVPFHTVFTVCWDPKDMHPVWVRNKINPAVAEEDDDDLIDAGIRTRFRFSRLVFGDDYNPRKYFTVQHQRDEGMLVDAHGDFMARGHLAPVGDFFLACERWATFSLENVVPQWQTHNNGAWKDIENKARHLNGAFLVETGPTYVAPSNHLDRVNHLLPVPYSLYKKVWDKHGNLLYSVVDKVVPAR